MNLIVPEAPPTAYLTEMYDPLVEEIFLQDLYKFQCQGPLLSRWDRFKYSFLSKPTPKDISPEASGLSLVLPQFDMPNVKAVREPSGLALFTKSDIEACDKLMSFADNDLTMNRLMSWLQYTLGTTCGVGIGWTDQFDGAEPHIRLYALPPSKMRGAIGWTWGPPLARNRRMELSTTLNGRAWPGYYILRTFMHEFGHFLGHYGTSAHSNRREDLMYPSVQNIKAAGHPRSGKSVADVAWEVRQFGEPWLVAA